jgi:hypothetical protein
MSEHITHRQPGNEHRQQIIAAILDFFANYQVPGKNPHNRPKTNFGDFGKPIKKAENGDEKQEKLQVKG